MDSVTFQFQIKYETFPGEEIYIYGDCPDFGNWKKPNFKLYWSKGHIWKADYKISKSVRYIKFKFVCHSKNSDKWEEGENRLLSPNNLNGLPKTSDGKYILDCVWNHFKINFNIHYVPSDSDMYMQMIGTPDSLSNWQKNGNPVRLELQNGKELVAKDGNTITGFWTVTVLMRNSEQNNLDFEYRYSLFNPKNGSAIWEREPNRRLHLFLDENEENNFDKSKMPPDSCYLLTNSFLEILDVNFVANLVFNKMGDKNIYIGPYPQSENDFKTIKESGINAILNVQTDKDFAFRQINHQLQLKQAGDLGLTIYRYPIEDFNHDDLLVRLKGAGDLLNKLIKEGKTVYVHCTAGMGRAAATVIIYLVLYEGFSVNDAWNFCKKYRPVICPNIGVINNVVDNCRAGR
jgi:protein-tyrosine phosphatase